MYVKKWNKLNLRCYIFFYSIEKISQYCINDLLFLIEEKCLYLELNEFRNDLLNIINVNIKRKINIIRKRINMVYYWNKYI